MTWVATQGATRTDRANIRADISLANTETGEVIEDYALANDLTPDGLSAIAQAKVEALEARDTALAELKKSEGRPIVLPRDKVLTPEEQDAKDAADAANAFFILLADYNATKISVEKGLVTAQSLESKAMAVKAAFRSEYEKDARYR